ncbi:hypothetical protein KKA23_00340 [Patescibacteria group bacterium]|nr:hypothetical protein [Patescibacteria group bacterium]
MKKQNLLKILVAIIIIIIIIIVLVVIKKPTNNTTEEQGEQTEQLADVKDHNIQKEIYGFSGEIKKIKNNVIEMTTLIQLEDESEEPIKTLIKANVSDKTIITKLVYKEQENTEEPIEPVETIITLEELKEGDNISIGTSENVSEKIQNKEEIDINYIFLSVVE